jgi:hypothetical protein
MSLDMEIDLQDRPADGEVSLDRLADVINEILSVPAAEGLALLVRSQLARAAASETQNPADGGEVAAAEGTPSSADADEAATAEEMAEQADSSEPAAMAETRP